MAGGFQRSSNFTVLEEVSAEPGALTADPPRPGWASPACPRTVLAYALAGTASSTVHPVATVSGTLSRNQSSEDVALYEAARPVGCFAYFTGPANGAWRMSHPHSAGHRRFEEPVPIPVSRSHA